MPRGSQQPSQPAGRKGAIPGPQAHVPACPCCPRRQRVLPGRDAGCVLRRGAGAGKRARDNDEDDDADGQNVSQQPSQVALPDACMLLASLPSDFARRCPGPAPGE